jgi:N-acetylneuraminic acid mutarotase
VNNKVYVGMGRNTNDAVLGDLYEYDESANDWIIVASIPSAPRVDAFSCFTATKGYIGLGLQYYQGGQVDELTDFWEFTP